MEQGRDCLDYTKSREGGGKTTLTPLRKEKRGEKVRDSLFQKNDRTSSFAEDLKRGTTEKAGPMPTQENEREVSPCAWGKKCVRNYGQVGTGPPNHILTGKKEKSISLKQGGTTCRELDSLLCPKGRVGKRMEQRRERKKDSATKRRLRGLCHQEKGSSRGSSMRHGKRQKERRKTDEFLFDFKGKEFCNGGKKARIIVPS